MNRYSEALRRARRRTARQFGVATREQLIADGLSPRLIDKMVQNGELVVKHRGVYAVAGAPHSYHQDLKCAELLIGDQGALSHRCAGAQWHLDGIPTGIIEVTTPRQIRLPGLIVHRSTLDPRDVRRYRGFPLTTPERTLMDLGSVLPRLPVEIATDSAFRLGLTTLQRFAQYIAGARKPGRRGCRVARQIAAERLLDQGLSHSALETMRAGSSPALACRVRISNTRSTTTPVSSDASTPRTPTSRSPSRPSAGNSTWDESCGRTICGG